MADRSERSKLGKSETGHDTESDLPRSVLDNLLEGCQVISPDYRYLYVNDSAARHGRTDISRLVGVAMAEAYPGIEDTAMFDALRQCMVERKPHWMENEFTYPDGGSGWFELRFEPVPEGVAILSVDITKRKLSEQELRRSNRALTALSECNQTLVRATDETQFMGDLCRLIVERGGYQAAWISLVEEEDPNRVRPVAQSGMDGESLRHATDLTDPLNPFAETIARVIAVGQTEMIRHSEEHHDTKPPRPRCSPGSDIASSIILPISVDQEIVGTLLISSSERDAFDEAERELLEEMALDLGYGVQTIRGREAHALSDARVHHLNAVLKGIRNVNQLITREHDPEKLIEEACRLLVESRGFHTSCIILVNGDRIEMCVDAGTEGMLQSLRHMLSGGTLPTCVRRVLEDKDIFIRRHPAEVCLNCPVRMDYSEDWDAVAVRLQCEDKAYGALLVSLPGGFVLDAEELDLLREVAGDVAFALRSIELQCQRDTATEELRATGEQLGAIVKAAPAAIFSFDADSRVTTWNGGAERLFGWSASETIGRPVPIIPDDKREEHEALKRRILAGESFSELEVRRLRRDGTTIWVSVSTAPLRDEEGNATGIMAVAMDVSFRKQTEREREIVVDFLRLANGCTSTRELVARSVRFFRQELCFEAVGIRLQEGDDFPYYETSGFPEEFVELERSLCWRDDHGAVILDRDQHPALDCMCGNVIRGRVDPKKPFFTEAGSFWSNDTTRLLATTTDEERLSRTRNRCNAEGYESVGLFPLRSSSGCLGLLQLNDMRPGRFNPGILALIERLSGHLGVALAKTRADEDLALSEARFRSLLNAVSDVVWAARPDGREYFYLSPSASKLYGRPPEEFLSNPALWLEVIHPEDRERVEKHNERLSIEDQIEDVYRILHPDGSVRWLHDRKAMVRNEAGDPLQIGGIATDITEQVVAKEALQESERRYRSLFENTTVGIAHCRMLFDGDRPHDFIYLNVNRAFEVLTGLKDVTGKRVTEVIPGIRDSDPRLFEIYGRVARFGTPERFEMFVEALREWFDVAVYKPSADEFTAVFDVITERKRTEERLLCFTRNLERLAHVVQELSQARSVDRIIEIVRQAARALVASDGATFVLRDNESCHYVDEDAIAPLWKGKKFPMTTCISGWAMLNRKPAVISDIYEDERIPHDAYSPTFVRSLVMVPIRSQEPIGAIGTYWATEHHATEEDVRILQALADSTSVAMENVRMIEELGASEARTRSVYEHLPIPTFVWHREKDGFVLADVNDAAKKAPLCNVETQLGKPPSEFLPAFEKLERDLNSCYELQANLRREVECPIGEHGKTQRFVLTYGFVPGDRVILHTEDVTEQRQTEEQLRLSQKLEAVGRLAGGVAHDFNNMLSVIINYAELAHDELREADPIRTELKTIIDAGDRAAVLTRQLLAFSRKQVLEPAVLELNGIISGIENMLRRLIGEDIEFVTHLADDLGRVEADPGQLEQVIMNLAINARDAMPRGGQLTIETRNVDLDEIYVSEHVGTRSGSFIQLSITDTGCGMDAETREQIFEPFFTTKEKGRGTGLGLSTVYGIVKQSGGNIWVYSEVDKGTTFNIYLPRVDAPASDVIRRKAKPVVSRGNETILVVEDEAEVLGIVERVLVKAGYKVITATNGGEALLLCEQHEGDIDLILTDVVMPRMSGRELTDRLRVVCPRMRALYMSGYTDNAIVHHGVLEPGTHFISKPFSGASLTAKVREVLDAEGERADD